MYLEALQCDVTISENFEGYLQTAPDVACDGRMLPFVALPLLLCVALAVLGPRWLASRPLTEKQTKELGKVFSFLLSSLN